MLEPRRVISNMTPLISLSLIRHLELLADLYGEVIIPAAVEAEILAGGSGRVGVEALETCRWIKRMTLSDPSRASLLAADLDRGEAEVIALAQELNADLVIIDERIARLHARRLGLPLTGTLGVLLRAKQRGLVSELGPLIEQLQRGGVRLHELVVAEALRLAGESGERSVG